MRIALAIAVAISACGKASPPDVTTGSAIEVTCKGCADEMNKLFVVMKSP